MRASEGSQGAGAVFYIRACMPGWVYSPLRDAQLTVAVLLCAWSQWTLEVNTHAHVRNSFQSGQKGRVVCEDN